MIEMNGFQRPSAFGSRAEPTIPFSDPSPTTVVKSQGDPDPDSARDDGNDSAADSGLVQADLCRSLVMAGREQVKRDLGGDFPPVLSHLAVSRSPHIHGLSCSESRRQPEKDQQDKATPRSAIMLLTDGLRSTSR